VILNENILLILKYPQLLYMSIALALNINFGVTINGSGITKLITPV
jgi:hypothetical protein